MAGVWIQWPTLGGGGGISVYATSAAFPASANDGDQAIALDTNALYVYDLPTNSWVKVGGPGIPYTIGGLDLAGLSANGAVIGSSSLFLQSATATFPGLINSASQTFSGVKTFNQAIFASNVTGSNTGDLSLAAIVGTTPSNNAASLSGQVLTLQPADATHAGVVSTTTQTFQGVKVFNNSISAPNVTGSSTGDISLTVVGTTPSSNAASLSGQVLTFQPADGTNPGVVSTASQTFQGIKTFNNPVVVPRGTVSLPGLTLLSDTATGLYMIGSTDLGITVGGVLGIEAINIGSSLINVGLGTAANASSSVPFVVGRTLNAPLTFQFQNVSVGTAMSTVLQIIGGSGSNFLTLENFSNNTTAYYGQGSLIGSSPNQTQLVIASEGATSFVGFTVTGRTLATEKMRLNKSDLTLNGGVSFKMTGSSISGGVLTQFANSSTSAYSLTWPGAQGAAGTNPQNDGSGNLTWVAGLTNPMTTSGDFIVGSGAGVPSRLAAGPAGSMIMSNGPGLIASWGQSPVSTIDLINLGLTANITGNQLVLALTQADGVTNPGTGSSSVKVSFRSSNSTSGASLQRVITSALGLTLTDQSTIGTAASQSSNIWIYLIDNNGAGSMSMGASTVQYTDGLQSTIKESFTATTVVGTASMWTATAHGLKNGDALRVTSSGSPPTPYGGSGTYYVGSATANTFFMTLNNQGPGINTSGSQTGTHTLHSAGYRLTSDGAYANMPVRLVGVANGTTVSGSWSGGTAIGTMPGSRANLIKEIISARYFSSTTAVTGAVTDMYLATRDYDTHNIQQTSSGGVIGAGFNVPITGKYQITAAFNFGGTYLVNQVAVSTIKVSGVEKSRTQTTAAASETALSTAVSDTLNLVQNDQVVIQAASGATTPTQGGGTTMTYMNIARMGD